MSERTFLLRFSGDLSTKRGRAFALFRGQLARNLRAAMRDAGLTHRLETGRNRFFLTSDASAAEPLSRVFGIQSFSPVEHRPWSTFEDLVRAGEELFTDAVRGRSFAVRVRRSRIRGQVDWTSEQLERALGARLLPHARKVDLGNPGQGVSRRTATFKTKVAASGTIRFQYRFDFFHAWYAVEAVLKVFAHLQGRRQEQTLTFSNWGSTGQRTLTGSMSIDVEQGGEFGFEIGGGNYDSTSTIQGTLTVFDFQAPGEETKE